MFYNLILQRPWCDNGPGFRHDQGMSLHGGLH